MIKINAAKVAHFTGHRGPVYAIERSIYHNSVYSASSDGFIAEWDLAQKTDGKLIADIKAPVYSVLLNATEFLLLCGTANGHMHVIDLMKQAEVRNIEAHQHGIFDLKFAGEKLISSGGDGLVKIWNSKTFELTRSIQASDKSARTIAVSPDSRMFAVGFSDNRIRIYETTNFDHIATLSGHTNSVFALAFSPGGNHLLSSGRDAMLKVWDVTNDYELVEDIPSHMAQVKCIAYNPSGNLFATCSMDKTIKIWDAGSFALLRVMDKERHDAHTNCINKLLWLSDRTLVSCSDDRSVMGWEISSE